MAGAESFSSLVSWVCHDSDLAFLGHLGVLVASTAQAVCRPSRAFRGSKVCGLGLGRGPLSRFRSSQLQPALLRGGTFDSKRVLYVHARDGLEDKLEPDDIGACLALPVSTLRKATLTAISDILKKLGEVMDTSAERGQERFLLFAALELTSAGATKPFFSRELGRISRCASSRRKLACL